ncbi:hypothetical protein LTR37_019740 [Vermiconidia calcicola]|uniref:Uncharacterized protein n=1 Tax=Vermiconidia calcicola TaxID=1690605 RepID=A0ACC3MF48_9PEZI|nr:hypothetical protein LTR37_019740 [Vermiconidia calcicola]
MASTNGQEWRKTTADVNYLVSTATALLDYDFIDMAFRTEDMYWAKPLPRDQLTTLLANSTTFGLYRVLPDAPAPKSADSPSSPRTPSPTLENRPTDELEQIGIARVITDRVTTTYLTDVYILPDYRTHGLGKWLIQCCNERAFLVTTPGVGKDFYTRELGFWDVREEEERLVCMTRRFFKMD